jgi:hypothetical protein
VELIFSLWTLINLSALFLFLWDVVENLCFGNWLKSIGLRRVFFQIKALLNEK